MTEPPRVDRRTRDTRDRILAAAADLFFQKGFPATAVREITAACSVTPGALYNHYASKEELLADIIRQTCEKNDVIVAGALQSGGSSPSRSLALMAREITWFHAEHQAYAMVVRTQQSWLPQGDLRQLLAWQRQMRRLVERLLSDGQARGEFTIPMTDEFDEAIPLAAKGLLDMWTQVGSWFKRDGLTSSTDVARLYARLTLQAVVAENEDELIDTAAPLLSDGISPPAEQPA